MKYVKSLSQVICQRQNSNLLSATKAEMLNKKGIITNIKKAIKEPA